MKKPRFTDSQILAILKQAEDGMSSAAFYKWCAKYGGMDASLMARMKELGEGKYTTQTHVCRCSAPA